MRQWPRRISPQDVLNGEIARLRLSRLRGRFNFNLDEETDANNTSYDFGGRYSSNRNFWRARECISARRTFGK